MNDARTFRFPGDYQMKEEAIGYTSTCTCRVDWFDFLHVRHVLIVQWLKEGKSPTEIADTLSMDPMQVQLIGLTSPDEMHQVRVKSVAQSEEHPLR